MIDTPVYNLLRGPWPARLRTLARHACTGLLPARCLLCTAPGAEGRDLCAACNDALPRNLLACPRCAISMPVAGTCGRCLRRPPVLHGTHAAFVYAAPIDRLLPRYKFHQDLAAGRLLAGLMAQALAAAERPHALVPVPLHAARLRQRGYDQALELARPLAAAMDLPLEPDLLRRPRATAAQSDLGALARRRNLRGAFAVQPGRSPPQHVALVDDVMTTGATLHAAAVALRRAGVQRVDAWVCARTP